MTEKEKAKFLIENFELSKQYAKLFAWITAEEIKKELERERVFEKLDYWTGVQNEIQIHE